MNILILAAGETNRRAETYPIWLSEIDGRVLLERQVQALSLSENARFIFAVRQEDIDNYHVDAIVSQIVPDGVVVKVRHGTAGAACTALLAVDHIDLDQELIVVSATDHIDVSYSDIVSEFRSRGASAGVLTFESLHPRYSFLKMDEDGWVIEAAEKRPISRHANAGFYWFSTAADFVSSLQAMILKDAEVNGVFYISPALNELVLAGKKIAAISIGSESYQPVKDHRQVETLEHKLEAQTRAR